MRALVAGGRGMLGADLTKALKHDHAFSTVVAADLPELDIADEPALAAFLDKRAFDVIFNCAAYTDVDACETHRDLAFAVNAAGAGNLAAAAARTGARLVHVSTDFVFSGAKGAPYLEDDPPDPLSAYGKSKLRGERLVAERGRDWAVARTAWLYGRNGKNFVDTVLHLAKTRAEVKGVTNLVGSPTWTRDLAAALVALAKARASGVFHTVNSGTCSRCEQVEFILACAGIATPVTPVDASAFPRPATIPAASALSTEKLRREIGCTMRPWQQALRDYVTTESPMA